jgi:WD40 repeat protein
MMMFVFPSAAQGAPDAINDALAALNQRLGLNLTLNDMFWTWEQTTFLDSALGCPQRGEITTQGSIIGYSFKFTWANEIYEYHVSADRTKTVFCGQAADGGIPVELVDAIGIDSAVELSNRLCPAPIAPDQPYIRSRLTGGVDGRISAGGGALNLRDTPNTNGAILAQMPELAVFTVTERATPACDSQGYVWWSVTYNGMTGYVAEGLAGEYFIEPLPPLNNLPTTRLPITTTNLVGLSEFAKLQGNFQPSAVAWSSTNKLVTLGDIGAEGVWVYNAADLTVQPRQYRTNARMVRAVFGSGVGQGDTLLLGSAEGTIHLWDLSPSSRLTERLVLNGHDSTITAVALAPVGGRIASTGGVAFATTSEASNLNAVLVWDINTISQVFALRGHTDIVTAIAFSPDGMTLATASLDKSVRLWDMANGQQSIRIDAGAGVTALAFSPDGTMLATGFSDGTTLALNLMGEISAGPVLNTHNAAVSSLTFTPDGATLFSVGLDSALMARSAAALFSGEAATRFTLPSEGGEALALSPDGTVIAIPSNPTVLRLLISPQS